MLNPENISNGQDKERGYISWPLAAKSTSQTPSARMKGTKFTTVTDRTMMAFF